MHNKIPKLQALDCSSKISTAVGNLPHSGNIKIYPDGFSYLDIDNSFIHATYPLLDYSGIVKPNYFSAKHNQIGAHISITYPEENVTLDRREENRLITFSVVGLFAADLGNKRYFALKVDAPDLIQLRHHYGLGDKLQLKGYLLELHITIATLIF